MTAMILAAGRGTRLRPLTDSTPKPMLEVHGEPLIGRHVRQLVAAGVTEIVVNLHHLGHMIEEFLGDGSGLGATIQYSRETRLLETGGGILKALPMLGDKPFWLLNGDIFTDFSFNEFPQVLPSGSDMHLLLTPTPEFRDTGDFQFVNGWVTQRFGDHVYCGIALLDPVGLRQQIHRLSAASGNNLADGAFSLRDLMFQAMAAQRLSAQVWHGYWTDIGTLDQLQQARATPL